MADARDNHNKWWHGVLRKDGSVFTEWGRVGMTGQSKDFPASTFPTKDCPDGESYLASKEKEKLAKGYTPLMTVANGSTTVVRHTSNDLSQIAQQQIKISSPTLTKLIQRLVEANIHQITSSTAIKFDSNTGLFSTPLGVVTSEGIAAARRHLDVISTNLVRKGEAFLDAVSSYLRIVPQNIGMRFNVDAIFPDQQAVQKQLDILDSLESSYATLKQGAVTASGKVEKVQEKVFEVELAEVDDAEFRRVEKKYRDTRKDMHSCAHLKVKKVYRVVVGRMAEAFSAKGATLGGVEELWHGTKKANLLSILKSGLQVSPPSTAAIAGKMYGNGIYFAPSSTKSLNYAYGYWGGGRDENCFMFLAQVAMGKTYVPRGGYGESYPKSGYDSVWAKGHLSGVINDECIVYRNHQCNLTHLVEFGELAACAYQ